MTQKHGLLWPRPRLALHPLPVPLLTLSHVGASVQESQAASLLSLRDLLPRSRPLTAEEAAASRSRTLKRMLDLEKEFRSSLASVKRPAVSVQTAAASIASCPPSPYDSGGRSSPFAPSGALPSTLQSGISPRPSGASGGSGQSATGALPCSLLSPTD